MSAGRCAPAAGWRSSARPTIASLRGLLPVGDFGTPGLPGMFSLAAPDRIRDILTASGFTAVTVDRVQAHGVWGHGAEDAAEFLWGTGPGRHLLEQADARTRERARRALTGHLRGHLAADGTVRLLSTSWLVTADRAR
jgi:hypothetical protein